MRCPECEIKSEVLETRSNSSGMRRRYVCMNGHRFSTQEAPINPSTPQQPAQMRTPYLPAQMRTAGPPSMSIWDRPMLVPVHIGSSRAGADDNLKIKSKGL